MSSAYGCELGGLLSGVVLLAGLSASAVELIADDRVVDTFSSNGSTVTTPSTPFANFVTGRQNSTVSSDSFAGSGSGYGESDFDYFIAESTFDITFSTAVPTDIALSGALQAANGDFGLARVRVRLLAIDNGTPVFADELEADFDFEEKNYSFDGTLPVGNYRLILQTDITPGGYGTEGYWSLAASFTPSDDVDSDGDGVADAQDNCTHVANANQVDANSDGYGNLCDADLNDDCAINAADLGMLRAVFFSTDPVADLNSDGTVNVQDLGQMRRQFFSTPGPSGLSSDCAAH